MYIMKFNKKVRILGRMIINGKVDDNIEVDLPVPDCLVDKALSRDGDDWDYICSQLPRFGIMNPIGKMHIDCLQVDGVDKVFH